MIPAQLVLQSGEVFPGYAPSWQRDWFSGEIVFTTGMTGYVESLTDPSYAGQLLTFTFPLIGNYGVPPKSAWESSQIHAHGVIVGTVSPFTSHTGSILSFLEWLKEEKVPLITGIDTRELTQILRKKGTVLGAISCGEMERDFPDPQRTHWVKKVSHPTKTLYGNGNKKIIVVDCGMKENILRSLSRFPITIEKVPYDYDYSEEDFDALFLSNGPGDPTQCMKTVEILKKALKREKPTFGICLGTQLLALAAGAKTYKLQFGHRGQNHPCLDLEKDKALLTSQNHGYAIDEKSLNGDWKVTFVSLNDGSVEGIAHKTLPFSAVQFHPEASPGPVDPAYLFERFYEQIQ